MPLVSNGSLFKLVDYQTYTGQEVTNRYWYYSTVAPSTIPASEIADLWEAIFTAWLPPVQSALLDHTRITVDEVTSIANFVDRASALPNGTLIGPGAPSYIAAKIRLFRTTKETRSGWKRIGVPREEDLLTNTWEAAYLNQLQALAAVMNDPLVATGGTAEPVLVRETKDPVTGNPLAPSLWIYNLIATAAAEPNSTTQNTRKIGRGS